MKISKNTGRLFSAALAVLTLAGCSVEKHIISYDSGASAKISETSPEIAKNDISAVLLLTDDPADGSCMSDAHVEAFTAAADELGITKISTVVDADGESALSGIGDANVIFGTGYDYMNVLDSAAKDNADKLYACFGGYKYNSTNYSNYYAAIYEAQYLAGIAAGSNTDSGKVGIISEYAAEYPDTAAEINSFALGARAACPDVEIIVYCLSSRADTENAGSFTEKLISDGCDVISIQCNTSAPAEIAAAEGVYFIGYGADMRSYGTDYCLTSVKWDLTEYYRSALTSATDGTWATDGNYYGTLSSGAVSLTEVAETADILTNIRIKSAAELITGDQFEIFSNKAVVFDSAGNASLKDSAVTDNKSNIMISEDGLSYFIYSGEELISVDPATVTSDKLASASMNYLVEGVVVK